VFRRASEPRLTADVSVSTLQLPQLGRCLNYWLPQLDVIPQTTAFSGVTTRALEYVFIIIIITIVPVVAMRKPTHRISVTTPFGKQNRN
jgi:hypothetical protein